MHLNAFLYYIFKNFWKNAFKEPKKKNITQYTLHKLNEFPYNAIYDQFRDK